ncbi:MAG: hypothetical protein QM630_04935 [Microbacterium sp.]
MAARRHVTNKLRTAYRKAQKKDRGRILDAVVATSGMGRSTARRMLTRPVLLPLWLPLLQQAGDLDKPFATGSALAELVSMSAATIDRYLAPARERMRL